MKKFILII